MKISEKLKAFVFSLTGLEADGKTPLNLSADQKKEIDTKAKIKGFAEKFEAKYNEDLDSTAALAENESEIQAFMDLYNEDPPEATEGAEGSAEGVPNEDPKQASIKGTAKSLTAKLAAERTARKKAEDANAKLSALAEPDNPLIINGIANKNAMKHSATHLFGSNNTMDAFEGRNWNKLAAGLTTTATTWTGANLDQLNVEIQDYFRKDPKKIISNFIDGLTIPAHWEVISGVSDEYLLTSVTTGEITQGLKKKWLPKNKSKFFAQKGKIRDIQIDIEYAGFDLKKLEKSYLNYFFEDGSNPHKMGFVLWVVAKILQQAAKENKMVFGKGVYAPAIGENAGSFLNNFSSVVKLALEQRGVSYKPFKFDMQPTAVNMYDYINGFCNKVPYEIKNIPDLYFYTSPSNIRDYNEGRRVAKGRDINYTGDVGMVDNFPNIKLFPYDMLEGSNFMFLTTGDNIAILTDKPREEGVIKFQERGRDIIGFGDYKLGAFIKAFGRNQINNSAGTYEDQIFFSNDVEALTDVYIPVEENSETPSLKYHNSLIIGENNTAPTDITNLVDAKAGTKIYLLGNSSGNHSTVKNNANISLLNGDCVLTKDTLLVLFAKADGKFQELKRTTIVPEETVEASLVIAVDATIVDASAGTLFVTSANTAATAITNITSAIAEETYRITGGSSTNATTIANAGNFALTAAITLNADVYIDLYYNGTVFVETARG